MIARGRWLLLVWVLAAACHHPRMHLPGHTEYNVREVKFEGSDLSLGDLPNKLGVRASSLTGPGQPWNPYRAAEDKRRVEAYWQTHGFVDVKVEGPLVERFEKEREVVVTWRITEGPPYRVASVTIDGAPDDDWKDTLAAKVPFGEGDQVHFQEFRLFRLVLSDKLRRSGWAHAECYSRAFVDRAKKVVHWWYMFDAGPKTKLGQVRVHGNKDISTQQILDRFGYQPGDPFDHDDVDAAQMRLYDTGAFNIVHVQTNADNEFLVGKLPPDTGGLMHEGMVDPETGKVIPRELDPALDVDITVVEAADHHIRAGVGGLIDTERVDAFVGLDAQLRNAFAPLHHLVMGGRVGYGYLFYGYTDEPLGLYGHGQLFYETPGFLHEHLDFRLGARFDEELFPGFHTRRLVAEMGFRALLTRNLHFDFAPTFRWEQPDLFGPFAADELDRFKLSQDTMYGMEIKTSLVWDERDVRIEASSGHLLGVHLAYAPGDPVGTHGWLRASLDLRGYVPLGESFVFAARVYGSWVFDVASSGVPPGARLFDGGAFGMRGFTRHRLTAYASACPTAASCRPVGVGALSLLTTSLEIRWLPFRKQLGAAFFVDVGTAGSGYDPFENDGEGVAVALGLSGKVRLWYLPMSVDIAFRVTDNPAFRFLDIVTVFFRVGEAF